MRRQSHGTINVNTNPGKTPNRLAKKHQPPPIDDDAATQIDGPLSSGKIRSSIEDDLYGGGQHNMDAPTAVGRGGTNPGRRGGTNPGQRQAGHQAPPPAPEKPTSASMRRLSTTLAKIFGRRREQIGLSVAQVAKLSGIGDAEIQAYEAGNGRLLYDHAIVLARVLGVRPQDMPGLRPREDKDEVGAHLADLAKAMMAGPVITFEGKSGERFSGDVDRLPTTPAFAIQIGDHSLGDAWPKGSVLAFVAEQPKPGDVTLLRHRRSKLLALRRLTPPTFNGLAPWQPAYVAGGEWLAIGRLTVTLPRLPE